MKIQVLTHEEVIAKANKGQKEKPFLVKFEITYDGLEFISHHIVNAKSKEEIEYMSEEDLQYYGHEGEYENIIVRHVRPLTDKEANLLRKLGI